MKKIFTKFSALIIGLFMLNLPASAIDLDQAKSQGLVGELSSGYLGVVKSSGDVNNLVNDVNSKRKNHYQDIANKRQIPVQAVEAEAGKIAIQKTPQGQYINTGGGWNKK